MSPGRGRPGRTDRPVPHPLPRRPRGGDWAGGGPWEANIDNVPGAGTDVTGADAQADHGDLPPARRGSGLGRPAAGSARTAGGVAAPRAHFTCDVWHGVTPQRRRGLSRGGRRAGSRQRATTHGAPTPGPSGSPAPGA